MRPLNRLAAAAAAVGRLCYSLEVCDIQKCHFLNRVHQGLRSISTVSTEVIRLKIWPLSSKLSYFQETVPARASLKNQSAV